MKFCPKCGGLIHPQFQETDGAHVCSTLRVDLRNDQRLMLEEIGRLERENAELRKRLGMGEESAR